MSYSLFPPTDLDLNDSLGTRALVWPIRGYRRLHLEVTLATGTWATAVVELKRSIGGNEYFSFEPAIILAEDLNLDIDVGNISYVVAELTTAEGGAGEVLIVAKAEALEGVDTVTATITPDGYATRIDEASATITYVGKAVPGTATSAATWQIQRLTDTGSGLTVEWADGDDAFDNEYDNRASLSYS